MIIANMTDIYEYTGEYGIEISTFIPYVYYLKRTGRFEGKRVLTYDGMQAYYFFLDAKEIMYKKGVRRYWLHPSMRQAWLPLVLKDEDKLYEDYNTPPPEFMVPDYKTHYGNFKLQGASKPIFVIQNKFTMEWGGVPISYITKETLQKVLPNLCEHFQVIYIRSNDLYDLPGYSSDHNEAYVFKLDEKDMLRRDFPEVIVFEDMLEELTGAHDFNTLKAIVLANAEYVLTTLGGATFFSLAFPCKKHIIHRCDRPAIVWPKEVFEHPYNLDPNVTTPARYTRQWFQNVHDILCTHPHGQVELTNSHGDLEDMLLKLSTKQEN
jgi:hypothetical protein